MSAKTMAEVLNAHYAVGYSMGDDHWECTCGYVFGPMITDRIHAEHQADALTAAGFALVADAKAEGLEDAAAELPFIDRPANIIARQQDAAHWLRERAASIREGAS